MKYIELYLRGSLENIIDSIKKKSEELGFELKHSEKENHIRVMSSKKGVIKESIKILLWRSNKRYPPNYPLLDIILFKVHEDVIQVLFRVNEVFMDVATTFYNELLNNYLPYHKWREFKELSTP